MSKAARKTFQLTEGEILELNIAESQVKKPQLMKRITAVKLKHESRNHSKVAIFLGVTIQTITHWCNLYREGGIETLLCWGYEGRPSILGTQELEEIREHNEKHAFETAKEAKDYIRKTYGIVYHLHHVQKLLKKNFDVHSKRKK